MVEEVRSFFVNRHVDQVCACGKNWVVSLGGSGAGVCENWVVSSNQGYRSSAGDMRTGL